MSALEFLLGLPARLEEKAEEVRKRREAAEDRKFEKDIRREQMDALALERKRAAEERRLLRAERAEELAYTRGRQEAEDQARFGAAGVASPGATIGGLDVGHIKPTVIPPEELAAREALPSILDQIGQSRAPDEQGTVPQPARDPALPPGLANLQAPQASPTPSAPTAPAPNVTEHVVAPGDTLVKIAKRYGLDPREYLRIARENNIANPNRIMPGQRIRIARAAPTTPAQPPPTDVPAAAAPQSPQSPQSPLSGAQMPSRTAEIAQDGSSVVIEQSAELPKVSVKTEQLPRENVVAAGRELGPSGLLDFEVRRDPDLSKAARPEQMNRAGLHEWREKRLADAMDRVNRASTVDDIDEANTYLDGVASQLSVRALYSPEAVGRLLGLRRTLERKFAAAADPELSIAEADRFNVPFGTPRSQVRGVVPPDETRPERPRAPSFNPVAVSAIANVLLNRANGAMNDEQMNAAVANRMSQHGIPEHERDAYVFEANQELKRLRGSDRGGRSNSNGSSRSGSGAANSPDVQVPGALQGLNPIRPSTSSDRSTVKALASRLGELMKEYPDRTKAIRIFLDEVERRGGRGNIRGLADHVLDRVFQFGFDETIQELTKGKSGGGDSGGDASAAAVVERYAD